MPKCMWCGKEIVKQNQARLILDTDDERKDGYYRMRTVKFFCADCACRIMIYIEDLAN